MYLHALLSLLLSFNIGSGVVSEIIIALLIALVLFIVFKIGKFVIKLVLGILINSILGLLSIFALDWLFGAGIPLTLPILIATALFGLPAVFVFVILRLFGVPL